VEGGIIRIDYNVSIPVITGGAVWILSHFLPSLI
jgi:hypothetical protein